VGKTDGSDYEVRSIMSPYDKQVILLVEDEALIALSEKTLLKNMGMLSK